MKKKVIVGALAVLLFALGLGVGVYANSNFGTQDDPLISKSYLDEVLAPKLKAEYENSLSLETQKFEEKISSLEQSQGKNFAVVSVAEGKVLKCGVGTEIIVRSGEAKVISATGLSDTTAGELVSKDEIVSPNHLLVVATENEGFVAEETVTVLIKGVYSIS